MWQALLGLIPSVIGAISGAAKDDPRPPPPPKDTPQFQPMQRAPAPAPTAMQLSDPGSRMVQDQPADLVALQNFRKSLGY